MQKEVSPKITALTFGILVVCFAIAFYVVAWQEPSQAPPGGNVPTPLNVGPSGQSKEGGLILNTGGALVGLIVDKGQTILKYLSTPFVFNSATRPTSPETGHFYFDQNDKNLYYYNGTMWMRIEAVPSGTGKPCTSPSQCESGYCVDGYCCNSACNTTCYSCAVPGREGKCTVLTNMAEDGGCTAACKGCYEGVCVNISIGQKDEVGLNVCTATHYRCDGSGSCTAPKTIGGYTQCTYGQLGKTIAVVCQESGYDGCYDAAGTSCCGCSVPCEVDWVPYPWGSCGSKTCNRCQTEGDYIYQCYRCWNWTY